MSLKVTIYNAIFKRTSTFALTAVLGAIVLETCIDEASEMIFNSINRGKLWHHIKDKYEGKTD